MFDAAAHATAQGHLTDAAGQFGFATPGRETMIAALRAEVRTLVVRAGQDSFAGLNDSIDAFISESLKCNRPLTMINHSRATHAFDLQDDGAETKRVIRSVLRFTKEALDERE